MVHAMLLVFDDLYLYFFFLLQLVWHPDQVRVVGVMGTSSRERSWNFTRGSSDQKKQNNILL